MAPISTPAQGAGCAPLASAAASDAPSLGQPQLPQPAAAPPNLAPTPPQLTMPQPTPAEPTSPQPAPPQPAAQLAPAFLALGPAAHGGAPQQLIIRLDPIELGHVQIRIDRPADGPAHVVLAVERADTMMLLLQDKPQLNQALDAAGVPPQGRTLHFDLSPGGGDAGSGRGRMTGDGGPGQRGSGSGDPDHHSPARPPSPQAGWSRTGIDITA
jgi:flagellar hook-length control protein FliK